MMPRRLHSCGESNAKALKFRRNGSRESILRYVRPMIPPGFEQTPLLADEFVLTGTEGVGRVEVMLVVRVALQHHQVFVVKNQVGTFIEGGKNLQRSEERR